jgi:hypothetical protein
MALNYGPCEIVSWVAAAMLSDAYKLGMLVEFDHIDLSMLISAYFNSRRIAGIGPLPMTAASTADSGPATVLAPFRRMLSTFFDDIRAVAAAPPLIPWWHFQPSPCRLL